MRKLWSRLLVGALLIVCLFGFGGCKKAKGPIPDGYYIPQANGEYVYCEKKHKNFLIVEKVHSQFYIKVEGNKIEESVSGMVSYKAKVVEKESKTYFEGYKWKDIFGDTAGNEIDYEITYDAETKTITKMQEIR